MSKAQSRRRVHKSEAGIENDAVLEGGPSFTEMKREVKALTKAASGAKRKSVEVARRDRAFALGHERDGWSFNDLSDAIGKQDNGTFPFRRRNAWQTRIEAHGLPLEVEAESVVRLEQGPSDEDKAEAEAKGQTYAARLRRARDAHEDPEIVADSDGARGLALVLLKEKDVRFADATGRDRDSLRQYVKRIAELSDDALVHEGSPSSGRALDEKAIAYGAEIRGRGHAVHDWRQRVVGTELVEDARDALKRGDVPEHDCDEHATPVETDGPLGHGWACGVCGSFLQAG